MSASTAHTGSRAGVLPMASKAAITASAQPRRSFTLSGMARTMASTETRGGGGGAAVIGRAFWSPHDEANAANAQNASVRHTK
jgi:hypothetical protein